GGRVGLTRPPTIDGPVARSYVFRAAVFFAVAFLAVDFLAEPVFADLATLDFLAAGFFVFLLLTPRAFRTGVTTYSSVVSATDLVACLTASPTLVSVPFFFVAIEEFSPGNS